MFNAENFRLESSNQISDTWSLSNWSWKISRSRIDKKFRVYQHGKRMPVVYDTFEQALHYINLNHERL